MTAVITHFRGEYVALDSARIDAAISAAHPLAFAIGVLDADTRDRLGIRTQADAAEFAETLTTTLDTARALARAATRAVPPPSAFRARRKAQRKARRANR